MTAVEDLPTSVPSPEWTSGSHRPDILPSLCPYLATPEGTWRSAVPVREHQCTAVSPPVQLAPEKQRRLCLTENHAGCATYGAAMAARATPTERPSGHLRPVARTTPVVLDQGRFDLRIPVIRADRIGGQAILVGLLGVAFVAVLLARPAGDGATPPPGPGSSITTPTDAAVAPPTQPPAETDGPAESGGTATPAVPSPSAGSPASPGASPTASAAPSTSGATYKVKSGDTLSAIAARFGTTTRVLVQLNGIADPSRIRIGQIIKLP
jgi:LysM repeat protein